METISSLINVFYDFLVLDKWNGRCYIRHPDPFFNLASTYHYIHNSCNFCYGGLKKIRSIFGILLEEKLETICQNF